MSAPKVFATDTKKLDEIVVGDIFFYVSRGYILKKKNNNAKKPHCGLVDS